MEDVGPYIWKKKTVALPVRNANSGVNWSWDRRPHLPWPLVCEVTFPPPLFLTLNTLTGRYSLRKELYWFCFHFPKAVQ